jgi:uncharacterized membrane protein YedE/YeeE
VLWFLLWLALFVAAAAIFAYLGRHLWRKAKALTTELAAASDRLAEITDALAGASAPPPTRSSDLR